MKNFRLIILLAFINFCFSFFLSKEIFKISSINDKETEIFFEAPNIEINNEEGLSKFKTEDLVGLTMDEGFPQMPIYSSLWPLQKQEA